MRSSVLLRPGRIGTLELKHRILMGAMHLGIEGRRETLEQLIAFYLERVRGGAALIITGNVAVLPEGSGHGMFCLTEPEHRQQLRELAGAIREAGGRMALQLTHCGRYSRQADTGYVPKAPSAIASRLTRETPEAMSGEDIARLKEAFADGAAFAQEAGFAGIEIMGSEGYLLNEFVSPLTNRREDEYGGDFDKRSRLCLEVVEGIRRRVGRGFPIIYRMSGDDCMEGSTTPEETLEFARRLEGQGVDALNVGVGWHESSLPTIGAIVPSGAFAHIVAAVRSAVSIPVIGANRIHTPEAAEPLLLRGDMDFIAPARPWLADSAFANKIAAGDRDGLNVCVSCNQSCLDHSMSHPPKPVGCMVNPRAGREAEPFYMAVRPLRVAVVGGGVAGLQAAKTAAERGHRVTLFEASDQLGGQFRLAANIPGKEKFLETIRYYEVGLQRLGVTVRKNASVGADELRELGFDSVIVATGVEPFVSDELEGADSPHVCTYADLLSGARPFGRRIVIIGGGGIGSDVAHYIAETLRTRPDVQSFFEERGYGSRPASDVKITLVSRSSKVAKGVGPTSRWVLLGELKRLGVEVLKGYRCSSITAEGAWVESETDRLLIPADQVVLCTGQRSRTKLAEALAAQLETQAGMARSDGGGLPRIDAGVARVDAAAARGEAATVRVDAGTAALNRDAEAEAAWMEAIPARMTVELVGGVREAAELNAARAIRQAYEIASRI
ncbi:FAD-dependent oxidoreductase [Cohnella lubricantis]|uniref:FAD-dependent oxidoreductase n=1 Tax=Cohnella lubricantis TaxID=2163172 RepID=A0A841TK33_9BACL|nr:FAD-dependent oxidoreductase [Cohnella lubricantis]MBB6679578.1 FAD-dependent oxidoreductase [Cohnella lubricantis]MBP2120576.1 2,4-dienoyl-CoA reductase (NADPH2) [Cohnella lubricantis]